MSELRKMAEAALAETPEVKAKREADDLTDVERLTEFWHSSGGDLMRNKDLAGISAEVLRETTAIKLLRDLVREPINPASLIGSAKKYLDELDRS